MGLGLCGQPTPGGLSANFAEFHWARDRDLQGSAGCWEANPHTPAAVRASTGILSRHRGILPGASPWDAVAPSQHRRS